MRALRSPALCIGILLIVSVNAASAAALGSFAASVGMFAALAALVVIKGLPVHVSGSALSTMGAALAGAAGLVWLWRARIGARVPAYGGLQVVGRTTPATAPMDTSAIVLPVGCERDALLARMRLHFLGVQEAWDRGDAVALQRWVTAEMLAELHAELLECPGRAAGCPGSRTEIVTLRAELLGYEALPQADLCSVEFSGLMRESAAEGAMPFREYWLLTRLPRDEDWRLARHQALL